jgi:ubiquitin fusion degradation protein 1
MMQNLLLREGDIVRVINTTLPKGTFVKLQPVTKDFLDIHNPKAVLENSLRHFATLTKGETIVLKYNNRSFEIDIVATKPSDAISIVEADVEVDFAPPKDYVEPQRVPGPEPEPVAPQKSALFSGSGKQLNGKQAKPLPIQPLKSSDAWGDEPWLLRVPGGVRRQPPYGYGKR